MLAFRSTRLCIFIGCSSHSKSSLLYRVARFHANHGFKCQNYGDAGTLTLSSVGCGYEVETENKKYRGPDSLDLPVSLPSSKPRLSKKEVKKKSIEHSLEIETAPFAAKTFADLGLSPLLIDKLDKGQMTKPTDIQSMAIPTVLKGHDVVIQSYTGSGKTLAYLLPILDLVGPLKGGNDRFAAKNKSCIEAVIVAPSRELGMQIVREAEKLLGAENKRIVQQLVGGANRSRQEEALRKNKPLIVVGTPGRIAEISIAGKLHTHDCRFLVLDEVDQLLSSNFREAMHRILEHVGKRKITSETSKDRQMVMVSATVPFPVLRAARSWCQAPLVVRANGITSLEKECASGIQTTGYTTQVKAVESLPPSLKHYYSVTKGQHKVDTLRRCIHALDAKAVICFMNNTRQLKDAVFKLEARGLKAAELHGDLGKLARSTILKDFKNGSLRVLVTNELSARGLDVPQCDLVVNLDLPTDGVHYAHRAGRSGRLGRKGTVVTVCEEPEVFVVKKLQRQLEVDIVACEFNEGQLVESNHD
ncbi:DEAD-box ATP-dependent RNA helicase 47A [Nymphaea thermarum]|nr:DEAD-box ATP-dependent RNA helicase 47A [Nymphaea thermarum]